MWLYVKTVVDEKTMVWSERKTRGYEKESIDWGRGLQYLIRIAECS